MQLRRKAKFSAIRLYGQNGDQRLSSVFYNFLFLMYFALFVILQSESKMTYSCYIIPRNVWWNCQMRSFPANNSYVGVHFANFTI